MTFESLLFPKKRHFIIFKNNIQSRCGFAIRAVHIYQDTVNQYFINNLCRHSFCIIS